VRAAGDGTLFGVRPRFHLAFPVHDLDAARAFYEGLLGCRVGRSAARWIDFDLFGHQISAHLVERGAVERDADGGQRAATNAVDGDAVPVPHFGLILSMHEWEALAERLRAARAPFVIEPRVRFRGETGEQATLFLRDPSGNALEFKAFADEARIFAR
jgi:extradiol dioxygenase family protein